MSSESDKLFSTEHMGGTEGDQQTLGQTLTMEARKKQNLPTNQVFGGPLNSDVAEPRVRYIDKNEKVLRHKNAYITFGRDRPNAVWSGYGAKGAQRCARIDIVVGRMSSKPDLSKGDLVNNSFSADAARIYLAQATSLDDYFGLADGTDGRVPNPKGGILLGDEISRYAGLSGIGIKADIVRVIGREGVKIVTGKGIDFGSYGPKGETNSRAGKIKRSSPPIELIAGNDTEADEINTFNSAGLPTKEIIQRLQPVAKGDNTTDALLELSNMLDNIWGALYGFAMEQLKFNSMVGTLAAARVRKLAWSFVPLASYSGKNFITMLIKTIMPLWQIRKQKMYWELNFLVPYGYKYICSKHVFST
jgi:hypothetical protein